MHARSRGRARVRGLHQIEVRNSPGSADLLVGVESPTYIIYPYDSINTHQIYTIRFIISRFCVSVVGGGVNICGVPARASPN